MNRKKKSKYKFFFYTTILQGYYRDLLKTRSARNAKCSLSSKCQEGEKCNQSLQT